jgi:Ca2+-binding RTX toxin-like protein
MATYVFSALSNNQTLTFKPATDTLAFDLAGLDAASGIFTQHGADLWITYAGKTLQLTGMTLRQLSSSRFTFLNGSKLLIGDDTAGTANDGLANTLTGTARGDYLDGLGGADTLIGGDGNDTLIGGTGNDNLYGRTGADTLVGGTGNDNYGVDSIGDAVMENPGEGIDTVQSWIFSYTLGAHLENLRLMGTENRNGAGNGLDNILYANSGHNVLNGGAGTDTAS